MIDGNSGDGLWRTRVRLEPANDTTHGQTNDTQIDTTRIATRLPC